MSQQSATEQKPSVGRIVHYQPYDIYDDTPEPLAAIVTAVNESTLDLCVLSPNEMSFKQNVMQAVDPLSLSDVVYRQSGRWNWPPRQ